jgi:hypothetical protein
MLLRLRSCTWIFLVAVTSLNPAAFGQNKGTTASLSKEAARWEHRVSGKVISVKDTQLQLETREKRSLQIDAGAAIKSNRVNNYYRGGLITVYGAYDAKGVLHAQSIQRAKNLPSAWPVDR